jgi:molecular chaperone GrpE
VHGARPPWYRTARSIGGVPWVPFEVARALQDQLDAHRARLQQLERELDQVQDLEQLGLAYRERIAGLEDALAQATERLAECEPVPSDETERIRRLSEDLARVRGRTEQEVLEARRAERADGLLRLLPVYDDLKRGLEALPQDPDSPWFQGYRAILQRLEQQLAQLGATPFGAQGDPFDPGIHEAVGTVAAPRQADIDRVVGVVQPGFAMSDGSLLRAAQVVVGT